MEHHNDSIFSLLMNRDIYVILDGDSKFEDYEFSDDGSKKAIKMPYLSGPEMCDMGSMFGLTNSYSWEGGNLSRWQYMEMLIKHCVEKDCCSELLTHLFDKRQFSKEFKGHNAKAIDAAYNTYTETIMGKINGILFFEGYELFQNGHQFSIRTIGTSVGVIAPGVKIVDIDYIRDVSDRAEEDIQRGNYDSAITKSRTLLEEVFCYVIEKGNSTPQTTGKINDLYKQVKDLYKMHSDANTDKRINTLLSGLEKIVSSISEMRNKSSDAHGVGSSRIAIKEHHARLVVNAAIAMADFILTVEKNAHEKT